MRVCINVQSLQKSITGIERYIYEVVNALDKDEALAEGLEVEAIFPAGCVPNLPELERVRAVEVSGWRGGADYVSLRRYLKRANAWYVSMSGGLAVQHRSIVCFHDLRPHVHKEYDSKSDRRRFGLSLKAAKVQKCPIVTTSNYVHGELTSAGFKSERITLARPGWEHMNAIKADDAVFDRHPELVAGDFYYMLGSLAPHKNLTWAIEVAKRAPGCSIALAGKLWDGGKVPDLPENVYYLGYVSDGESKALMQSCRAFVHPSKYEGFGLPPLEAMVCGAHVLAARGTAVEGEYGDAIRYFSPDDYDIDLDQASSYAIDKNAYRAVMDRCSWKRAARAWAELFLSLR